MSPTSIVLRECAGHAGCVFEASNLRLRDAIRKAEAALLVLRYAGKRVREDSLLLAIARARSDVANFHRDLSHHSVVTRLAFGRAEHVERIL